MKKIIFLFSAFFALFALLAFSGCLEENGTEPEETPDPTVTPDKTPDPTVTPDKTPDPIDYENGDLAVTDCGTDMDCLINAAQDYELAKASYQITLEEMGFIFTNTTFFEIKEAEEGKCVLFLRTEEQEIGFPDDAVEELLELGISQEEIDKMLDDLNEQSKEREGLTGACSFTSNEDLASFLSNWKDGTIFVDGWDDFDCEGELFQD